MKQKPDQAPNGTSRTSSSNGNASPRRRRSSLLRIEPLEARRLLASLQVSVFIDQDGSRQYESSRDAPAENRLVFLDLNEDSIRNPGEPVAVTDSEGIVQFDSIEPGDYAIGLIANSQTQRVVSGVRVSPTAEAISDLPANRILLGQDDQSLWSFDGIGRLANIESPEQVVELPGQIEASVAETEHSQILLVRTYESEDRQIIRFDTRSGNFAELPLYGLEQDQQPTNLLRSADGFLVEVESTYSRSLVELELGPDHSRLGFELADQFDLATASPTLESFVTVTNSPSSSRVLLDDGIQSAPNFVDIDGVITEVNLSDDGALLFASMADGGVNVIAISDSSLRRTAILADAGRIVSARSRDGRILTGSTRDEGKLIVWDPNTWLPLGSSRLPVNAGAITSITSDVFGDYAYIGTDSGLYKVEIGSAATTRASTNTSGAIASIGVRSNGENRAPETLETTREVLEDAEDQFSAGNANAAQDADGDLLWFSLATPPSNGQLHVDVDNNWRYEPDPNFAGSDSAVLRVHDGQATTELVLRWDVEAVNDPPVAVHIQLPAIPENPEAGASIGFISIEDPDQDAEYLVTTSDPRFAIQGGQIFFVDGELDFDAEPNVEFEIVATDATNSSYVISSETTLELTNVNEPATGLTTDFEFAPENFAGAEFGLVQVDDPDADSQYEFELSDERFEIVDGILKLADDVALDFEETDEISLTVTANEVGGDDSVTQEISVNVSDVNDQPTAIRVSAFDLIAGVEGAVIGTVSVEDQDGDAYDIYVSDGRFEVADGLLKLRPGETVQGDLSQFPLTLTARARTGDQLSRTFPINVLPPPPPNQNPADRHDINGDGIVSPLDVLFLINEINRGHGGQLPPRNGDSPYADGESPIFPDVNGDDILSPIDVLELINELNRQDPGDLGGGEGEYAGAIPNAAQIDFSLETERKKTAIDSELESLLAELSEYRIRKHS